MADALSGNGCLKMGLDFTAILPTKNPKKKKESTINNKRREKV